MKDAKHSFPPVIGEDPHTLILGSMPGEESLRQQQYYAHPRNAFWTILADLYQFPPGLPYAERLEQIQKCGIALWDVLKACHRTGSLDSNIRNATPNAIGELLQQHASIRRVACNGTAAFQYFKRSFPELLTCERIQIVQLPSSSPAAARISPQEKAAIWRARLI